MFKLDLQLKVIVNLKPGIYIIDSVSAIGKTYLCNFLKECNMAGYQVMGYTYSDYKLGLPIENILVPGKYKVVLLDRYDMYFGVGKELLSKCAKDTIILIDYKGRRLIAEEEDWCTIERTQDTIEVCQ